MGSRPSPSQIHSEPLHHQDGKPQSPSLTSYLIHPPLVIQVLITNSQESPWATPSSSLGVSLPQSHLHHSDLSLQQPVPAPNCCNRLLQTSHPPPSLLTVPGAADATAVIPPPPTVLPMAPSTSHVKSRLLSHSPEPSNCGHSSDKQALPLCLSPLQALSTSPPGCTHTSPSGFVLCCSCCLSAELLLPLGGFKCHLLSQAFPNPPPTPHRNTNKYNSASVFVSVHIGLAAP